MSSSILNAGLAPLGQGKIDWVEARAPVMKAIGETVLSDGSLKGVRLGLNMPIEPKVAFMCITLARAGADVTVSTKPYYVHDDVAAALAQNGVNVHGRSDTPVSDPYRELEALLASRPHILMDGAGNLGKMIHTTHTHLLEDLRAISEETTSGVTRFKTMHEAGELKVPVMAANDARMKYLFDNRYGTGQSGVTSLLSATNMMIGGKRVAVYGFSWVGKGLARYLSGLGAHVTVVEIDPVIALEAYAEGYEVADHKQAAIDCEVHITATGTPLTIGQVAIESLRDGAILENVGGIDTEIDTEALLALTVRIDRIRPHMDAHRLHDGRTIYVMGQGKVFNLTTAAEGHPIEIMDLTFGIQLLCMHHLARHAGSMAAGVHEIPAEFDERVARVKLEALGLRMGELTNRQRSLMSDWRN